MRKRAGFSIVSSLEQLGQTPIPPSLIALTPEIFVQDLTWLLVGWLADRGASALPSWYDPSAETIKYQDSTTQEWHNCTHQPNYQSIYSAYLRVGQDAVTGELGVKTTADSEYAVEKGCISQAVLGDT